MSFVKCEDVSFAYGRHEVLHNISFELDKAELCCVLGKNGSGKSTLFSCILGLRRSFSGRVSMGGTDIRKLAPANLAGLAAAIPQSCNPAFGYTAFEMVLMGAAHRSNPLSIPGSSERRRANELFERMGIRELSSRRFNTLSGGERRMVLICRALFQNAPLLVMDEPNSDLDFGRRAELFERVRGLCTEGHAVLLSTHDPQAALTYASRVIALHDGSIICDGPPEAVLTPSLLHRLYGVKTQIVELNGKRVIITGDSE